MITDILCRHAPNLTLLRTPKWNLIDENMVPFLKERGVEVQSDGEPGDSSDVDEPV
jgi:hypothetical protein